MATSEMPLWLETICTQVGLRPGIVLHGEINDIRRNPVTTEYERVPDLVSNMLRTLGYDVVIQWDRVTGIRGADASKWGGLIQAFAPSGTSGTAYSYNADFGLPDSGQSSQPSVDDFLSVVHHCMTRVTSSRIAFVVEWSQLLFAPSQQGGEAMRQQLTLMARALRGPDLDENTLAEGKQGNLLILTCRNPNSIPPEMLPGSAFVQELAIPLPDRSEREQFLNDRLYTWRLRDRPRAGQIAFHDLVDTLDGMSLQDFVNLERLSRQTVATDDLTVDQLINFYRHGVQRSPWENLNREKLQTIRRELGKRVKGQQEAIEKVATVIIRAYSGLAGLQHSHRQRMPKGTLFFVGPTGVGKTELAKSLASFLFGDEEAFIRFDMSEFNHEHSDQRLIGAPPGYVGYEEGGQLTNAVRKRPFCVLLFDEIEKAHVRILDKFLQILEDGRLTDGRGETTVFADTIIIFTSNIGAAQVDPRLDVDEVRHKFLELVRDHFVRTAGRPELLNRIGDNIVPFNFIKSEAFLVEILRGKLRALSDQLKEKYRIIGITFDDEERALKSIAGQIDRSMGGRGALTRLVSCLLDPLALHLFDAGSNASEFEGSYLHVHQSTDEPVFTFTLERP